MASGLNIRCNESLSKMSVMGMSCTVLNIVLCPNQMVVRWDSRSVSLLASPRDVQTLLPFCTELMGEGAIVLCGLAMFPAVELSIRGHIVQQLHIQR